MTAHEFIFGDRFEECLRHICVTAYKANTRKAYREAELKLEGIKSLCHWIAGSGDTPMSTAIIMIGNLQIKCRTWADTFPPESA